MAERLMIFSGDSVKAIQDGRKTMTRRVIKPQPKYRAYFQKDAFHIPNFGYIVASNTCALLEHLKCPYGQVGDVLWAKEKHAFSGNGVFFPDSCDGTVHIAWTSSRFMRKEYARIWLEITGIRVEKTQDIMEQDAEAEGVDMMHLDDLGQTFKSYRRGFQSLWDSINTKRGYSWDKNPWVWCISFKRLER